MKEIWIILSQAESEWETELSSKASALYFYISVIYDSVGLYIKTATMWPLAGSSWPDTTWM